MWDMDWTAVATKPPCGGASTSTDPVAPTQPAASSTPLWPRLKSMPSQKLHRELSPPVVALGSAATGAAVPVMATPERESLQQKLQEKRNLAELHNGKDMFAKESRREFAKGSMPGVNS